MKPVGRTVRTFRNSIDIEEARWKQFKRTLRPSQKEYLDRIFESARKSADAGTMIVTPRIAEVVLFSAIMELLRELDRLREKVAEIEQQMKETTP
jgi:hypothetical protein